MTTQKAVPTKAPTVTAAPAATTRRPWVKKTTVEVVLDQIHRQEEKVAGMRAELTHEERELAKLQQAKKVLEGA